MNKIKTLLLILVLTKQICALNIKELDEIFEEVECIEGELILSDNSHIHEPQLLLLKTKDIVLSSNLKETPQFLVQTRENVEDNKNTLNSINELAQFNQIPTEFILIDELGEPHDKTFRVRLNLGDEVYQAAAKTIKDAKRKAALTAWTNTKYPKPAVKTREEKEHSIQTLTPTVHLNNIAGKLGMKVEYYNEREGNALIDYSDKYLYYSLDTSSKSYMSKLNKSMATKMKTPNVQNEQERHHGPFRVRVDVGDESFIGSGWTLQAARHAAAEEALEKFKRMSLQDADDCLNRGQLCNKLNVKSAVSLVHETAEKHQWHVGFDVISDVGPAHKKVFVTRCKVADLVADGEGGSKKESKRKAAEAMLKLLDGVQPWDLINVQASEGNNQKSKKKKQKRKKIKRTGVIEGAAISVMDAFSTILGANEKTEGASQRANDKGPKGELLDLAKEIGIDIKFSSYHDQHDGQHASMATFDTNPAYHCYSKDVSATTAEDNAALNALKFLKHVGLDNVLIPLKEDEKHKIILLRENKSPQVTLKEL